MSCSRRRSPDLHAPSPPNIALPSNRKTVIPSYVVGGGMRSQECIERVGYDDVVHACAVAVRDAAPLPSHPSAVFPAAAASFNVRFRRTADNCIKSKKQKRSEDVASACHTHRYDWIHDDDR